MMPSSIGDLARGLVLRRQQTELKSELTSLSEALVSGQKQDLRAELRGDYRPLASIDKSLDLLDAYDRAGAEISLVAETMQNTLGSLAESSQGLATSLLVTASNPAIAALDARTEEAGGLFSQAVSKLNTEVAGRTLFSGAATDAPALNSADDMMTALKGAIAGLTVASDIRDAVVAWFDTPGGGFDQLAYNGTAQASGPVLVAPTEKMDISITAADPALRGLLSGLALASLANDGNTPSLSTAERTSLVRMSGEKLAQAGDEVTELRTNLGTIQARLETLSSTNAAERMTLETARNEITLADPFETATALEDSQTRLETLYAITARLSRLSLADYLS